MGTTARLLPAALMYSTLNGAAGTPILVPAASHLYSTVLREMAGVPVRWMVRSAAATAYAGTARPGGRAQAGGPAPQGWWKQVLVRFGVKLVRDRFEKRPL
jgi:hypothetical protein